KGFSTARLPSALTNTVWTTPESRYDLHPAYAFAMRSSRSRAVSASGFGSPARAGPTATRRQQVDTASRHTTRIPHPLLPLNAPARQPRPLQDRYTPNHRERPESPTWVMTCWTGSSLPMAGRGFARLARDRGRGKMFGG